MKIWDERQTTLQVIFVFDEYLAMNFIQIYANFCWCHIDINAVTRVFHEFSCQRVFFIMYNFYIATCAIFLGVLWKKPHQNWKIFWKNMWKIADMGPKYVSKKTSNSLCFSRYSNWPHGQMDSRTLHLAQLWIWNFDAKICP